MSIQSVAILGAGAVGSYFIWGFEEKYGENLHVVAEGERLARLKREGITINGQRHMPHFCTPREAHGADVLLVATKYDALRPSLDAIGAVVGENTLVLSVLNGVDSEQIIAERIGEEHLLDAVMYIASRRVGQEVYFDPEITRGLCYGDRTGGMDSEKMRKAAELFAGTPLHSRPLADIRREMWYKYAFNVSLNLPQAIVNCGLGAIAVSEHMANLRWKLRDEVCAVAAAEGVDISERAPLEQLDVPSAYDSRYSTLQDLDGKRHTEIEMFSGTMLRLAKKHGMEVPYNAFAYHVIKAMEERNDGKFDF